MTVPILDAQNADAVRKSAELLRGGAVLGVQFNGAYALLADVENTEAADRIFVMKKRPAERTLAMVTTPDEFASYVDRARLHVQAARLAQLQRNVHALGLIAPALDEVPTHLVVDGTVLNVWSECPSLSKLLAACRHQGGATLQGASANISGSPTLAFATAVVETFGSDLGAIYLDSSARIETARKTSTAIVDATGTAMVLRRDGNVSREEVAAALVALGLGELVISDDLPDE